MKGCFYAYVAIKSLSPPCPEPHNFSVQSCNRAQMHLYCAEYQIIIICTLFV